MRNKWRGEVRICVYFKKAKETNMNTQKKERSMEYYKVNLYDGDIIEITNQKWKTYN